MAKSSLLLKSAALVSSITLVAGFVSHQAGAFPWHFFKIETPSTDTGEAVIDEDPALPPGSRTRSLRNVASPPAPTFIGSSKSIVIRYRSDESQQVPVTPPPPEPPVAVISEPVKSPK